MGVARQNAIQCVDYLRRTINYNDLGASGGLLIGTVPAGSKLTSIHIYIETAFNAATTNVLQGGITGTGSTLFTSTDAAAGTAGVKTPADSTTQARGLSFASDTDLFVSYSQTGTAATAGVATIIVLFVPLSNGG